MSPPLDPSSNLTRPEEFDGQDARSKTGQPIARGDDRLALNLGRHYSLTTSQYQVPGRGAGLPAEPEHDAYHWNPHRRK